MNGLGPVARSIKEFLRQFVELSVAERLLISVVAVALSVVVGFFIILATGRMATCGTAAWTMPGAGIGFCYDPFQVYAVLFNGALGYPFLIGEGAPYVLPTWMPVNLQLGLDPTWTPFNLSLGLTLSETTLLVFTGLSVAVAFRAGLFNIGTQGQLVIGALLTALVVVALAPYLPAGPVGGAVLITVGVAAGALGGGLWGAIPGALKAYADANEVITTIMLNFIAANVAYVLVLEVFRAPGSSVVATKYAPEYAQLNPWFFPNTSGFAELALLIAVAFVAGLYVLVEHTPFGFDLRTSGIQPLAAEYGGVDAKRTTVSAMTLSGALGGVGGAVWVLMKEGRWLESIPALGFDGITVSILAGNNPLGVIPAALLFGVLKGGALEIGFQTDVPTELVGVLRGLIILFVAMPEFFRQFGRYLGLDDDPVAPSSGDGGGEGGTGGPDGETDTTAATDGGTAATDGGETDA